MSTPIPKSFVRARTLVTPILAAAARTLDPEIRRVAEYHWGFRDENGRAAVPAGGKALRPTLVLLSAEAVGADPALALAGAAAVEIVHDFTLLHDDIMDGDRERRHRPAAWVLFGIGPALCAGDALVLLAQRVLLEDETPHGLEALRHLGLATEAVIAGQARDLALEGCVDPSVADYLEMTAGKTGALLGGAAAIGAVLGGGSEPQRRSLEAFGRRLGLAFQAMDDWLGIWGDPARTGKPIGSDLRRRKTSLPVVHALADPGPAGDAVRAFMAAGEPPDAAAAAAVSAHIEATGAGAATLALARRELGTAREALARADLAPRAREELEELARFVVEREF